MEELLRAIKYLHFAKQQGTITSYNIIDEEEIEFKFKINGFEENDSCSIEEYKTIGGRIREAETEYWQDVKEDNEYLDQLNSNYTQVCCG
ncbi:hypothetical protein LIY46_04095 [Fusobacterium varium]|mgnify:CR=1 FL=1|jgi:hypothetical protein|uniref:hypothetical protein n=1 Tax=Fusobacterium TaxID=848 RepID=UPI0026DB3F9B|nr:hypothetical protein [Fusobacterium ulcerans]